MSTHTLGPWLVHPFSAWVCPASAPDTPVCAMRWPCDDVSEDETEANARLIAAAPDLLALLRELIDIEGPCPGNAEWAEKVRATIESVTGDQP